MGFIRRVLSQSHCNIQMFTMYKIKHVQQIYNNKIQNM